jgi:TonB family protein
MEGLNFYSVLLFGLLVTLSPAIVAQSPNSQPIVVAHPLPPYPPLAWVRREQGEVLVDVTIAPTGRVISASTVKGTPLLGDVAQEKSREWIFDKVSEDAGVRTARLTFVFHLQDAPSLANQPEFTPPYRVDIIPRPAFDCFNRCGKSQKRTRYSKRGHPIKRKSHTNRETGSEV